MMVSLFQIICLVGVITFVVSGNPFENGQSRDKPRNFGYRAAKDQGTFPTGDTALLPQNVLSLDDLLDELDWRDYDDQNYCTWSRNQHMPYYCGSCWAMSTTSCLADRYMIRRGNAFPEITIAPQVLLDCDHVDFGCHGGDAASALEWIYDNSITDETCSAYVAVGWDINRNCTGESYCKNCMSGDGCWPVDSKFYQQYGVTQYGFVSGETNMMKELSRGPIICCMAVTDEFYYNYTSGVFIDTTNYTDIDHLISIVGYGTSNDDVDYWIGRNSWGTFWGIDGFFKIIRGVDNLAIEEACYWMEPDTTNFSHLADYEWARDWGSYDSFDWATQSNVERKDAEKRRRLEESNNNNERINLNGNGIHFQTEFVESENIKIVTNEKSGLSYAMRTDKPDTQIPSNWGLLHDPDEIFEPVIKSPLPRDIMANSVLPTEFSWHNVNETNYLTTPRNQHIPAYCGSCWAFSTTSMVGDRLNIIRKQDNDIQWPEVDISPQALINSEYAGDCDGGYPGKALKYMLNYGLPDETCQIYQAINDPHGNSTELNICYNCDSIAVVLWPGVCYEVTDYTTYYVTEYGSISNNVTEMKEEIYSRGPIACEMTAVGSFWHYEGGVYSDSSLTSTSTDHVITIVGWSYDSHKGQEYWIARNSWGMYWGEDGFFRIEMYENNLNIEKECYWAVVEWNSTNSTSDSSSSYSDEEIWEEEVELPLTFGEKLARLAIHSLL